MPGTEGEVSLAQSVVCGTKSCSMLKRNVDRLPTFRKAESLIII